MTNLSADDLRSLPRRDLQALAKSHSLKANGSSNKLIEALCDRFPDGVPPLKRGASPTTNPSRAPTGPTDRRLSRHAKPQLTVREPTSHQPLRVSSPPSGSSRNASGSLRKSDTQRLNPQENPKPIPPAGWQLLQPEGPKVLVENERLMLRMMKGLQEARATITTLASENAILRAQLAPPPATNALQLGEDVIIESSSQVTQLSTAPTSVHVDTAGQPMTPASLRPPQAGLPIATEVQLEQKPGADAPFNVPVGQDSVSSFSSYAAPPPSPSSPVGLTRIPRLNEKVNDLKLRRESMLVELALYQEWIKITEASIYTEPSDEMKERLQEALKAVRCDREMNDSHVSNYRRTRMSERISADREEEKRSHGALAWEVCGNALETYPHRQLSPEEKENMVRFRNWAVRKDEITLPLVLGRIAPSPLTEDETDADWLPSGDPDYDATSDATPSELEDVEMQDLDMSVEDDLVQGVEGEGIDALLTDLGAILRKGLPKHVVRSSRASIPDPQGFVKPPQGGRSTQVCWVPVKGKERVWVRCEQEVCTHGAETPGAQQAEGTPGEGQQSEKRQEPCYFFDGLPEVPGRPKPKGRWVERDVDLLEGGKYAATCIKSMDEHQLGRYGRAWGVNVNGWMLRLERVPVWEH